MKEIKENAAMTVDPQLVNFLIENHIQLVNEPLCGHLRDVFALYMTVNQHDHNKYVNVSLPFIEFVKNMDTIAQLSQGCVIFQKDDTLSTESRCIELLDVYLLKLLRRKISPCDAVVSLKELAKKDSNKRNSGINKQNGASRSIEEGVKGNLLDRLLDVLDTKKSSSNDLEQKRWNHALLSRLESTLEVNIASIVLSKERVRETVLVSEYMPTCRDHIHASMLSTSINIIHNRIVSVQWPKIIKCESQQPGFMECLQSKIHYIPNLKPQTDLSLGDCSYLDTCHKLNTCRYIHYLQYIPEGLKSRVEEETVTINERIKKQKKVPFYTHGECCSSSYKIQLPPQWIKCDVRKFDFKILGKFSAVIADPAWNIHMNLPYGTCNDIELLELPLDNLQDEGILFLWVTGRAIELGKESLQNWGYEVINEISWIKTNQLGRTIVTGRTGHWLNHSKEHLLVGLKGNPKWINKQIDTDIIVSTTRETSRKPDELYGMIERMVGPHARKLEIFGRDHNVRPGWFTIGNQLTGNCIHELDVKNKFAKFSKDNGKFQHKNKQSNNNRKNSLPTNYQNKNNSRYNVDETADHIQHAFDLQNQVNKLYISQ